MDLQSNTDFVRGLKPEVDFIYLMDALTDAYNKAIARMRQEEERLNEEHESFEEAQEVAWLFVNEVEILIQKTLVSHLIFYNLSDMQYYYLTRIVQDALYIDELKDSIIWFSYSLFAVSKEREGKICNLYITQLWHTKHQLN